MTDNASLPPDPVWDAAWLWVQRQHDVENFDARAQADLVRWLAEEFRHRQAYEKAGRLWLLTGLIPPSIEIDPISD